MDTSNNSSPRKYQLESSGDIFFLNQYIASCDDISADRYNICEGIFLPVSRSLLTDLIIPVPSKKWISTLADMKICVPKIP